ncbi:MAG: divalent-cation tolerance protein CutA [Helicobacteraceae bacterium]|jgi:periplasmic divalent cation tolerance protein|nr:divalent-cation tolerance protein CutA [Helicobacteraceae bacterium]
MSETKERAMILAMTTVGGDEEAQKLASELVSRRLAACASIAPNISSVYWWKGAIETSGERLVTIKTTREKIAAIEEFFKRNHPYELPELIFIECKASADYEAWVKESLIG